MHIEWEWIFQRPQILALMLANRYDCSVVYPKLITRRMKSKAKTNVMPNQYKRALMLPMQNKFSIIKKINMSLFKRALGNIYKYDIVWLTHPELFRYIPSNYNGKIIYDCMDNHVAMAYDHTKDSIKIFEDKLLLRADVIFASSQKLINNLKLRLDDSKFVLLRNGFMNMTFREVNIPKIRTSYNIGYFGSISTWFDYELLYNNTIVKNNITYHLIGPNELEHKDTNQIKFEGIVEHSKLYDSVKYYDCLIMPFKINDIILFVDPVKLYEYICFGKCIISVYYPEIERFNEFVYFYNDEREFDILITDLCDKGFPPKYNSFKQSEFLTNNTWEIRFENIVQNINVKL